MPPPDVSRTSLPASEVRASPVDPLALDVVGRRFAVAGPDSITVVSFVS